MSFFETKIFSMEFLFRCFFVRALLVFGKGGDPIHLRKKEYHVKGSYTIP